MIDWLTSLGGGGCTSNICPIPGVVSYSRYNQLHINVFCALIILFMLYVHEVLSILLWVYKESWTRLLGHIVFVNTNLNLFSCLTYDYPIENQSNVKLLLLLYNWIKGMVSVMLLVGWLVSWYLYEMATQNILRPYAGK